MEWKQWKQVCFPKSMLLSFKTKRAFKASPQTSELAKFWCSCLGGHKCRHWRLQGEKLKNISQDKDISVV